jgi:hypothetical protein
MKATGGLAVVAISRHLSALSGYNKETTLNPMDFGRRQIESRPPLFASDRGPLRVDG